MGVERKSDGHAYPLGRLEPAIPGFIVAVFA